MWSEKGRLNGGHRAKCRQRQILTGAVLRPSATAQGRGRPRPYHGRRQTLSSAVTAAVVGAHQADRERPVDGGDLLLLWGENRGQLVAGRARFRPLGAALLALGLSLGRERFELLNLRVGEAKRLLHRVGRLVAALGAVTGPVVEDRLDPAHFARIHRSTIVRLDRVEALLSGSGGDYTVRLTDGTRLRVSRSRRDALVTRLGGTASGR